MLKRGRRFTCIVREAVRNVLDHRWPTPLLLVLAFPCTALVSRAQRPDDCRGEARAFALVGITVIDGTGSPAKPDQTVVICGTRIAQLGPHSHVRVLPSAQVIDGRGRFLIPGFVDPNTHLTLFLKLYERRDTIVRDTIVVEALKNARVELRHGTTTLADTWGLLEASLRLRDTIRAGAVGPRVLVSGNIVGWDDPLSATGAGAFFHKLTPIQIWTRDQFAQGVGEDLIQMDTVWLRKRIARWLDRGIEFVKYGGTAHPEAPGLITFSLDAQRVIIDEAHKRGIKVSTHCDTPEALRMCVQAGVDAIVHANTVVGLISDELASFIAKKGAICLLHAPFLIEYDAEAKTFRGQKEWRADWTAPYPFRDGEGADHPEQYGQVAINNTRALIQAGCIIGVESDRTFGVDANESQPSTWPIVRGVVALTKFGLSPLEAIKAGTHNNALAVGGLPEYGTVEAGKRADLVVLDADPTADIQNLERQALVIRDGRIVVRNGVLVQ